MGDGKGWIGNREEIEWTVDMKGREGKERG